MAKISEARANSRAASDGIRVTHKDGTKETLYAEGYRHKKAQQKAKKK